MTGKLRGGSTWLWPLVVLVIAFGAFWLKPWQTKPAETISVTVQGQAQAVPNIAKINATIESKNPNLDSARRENEQKVSALISKLKELGVGEKDIKTQYISGGPNYEVQSLMPEVPIYPIPPRSKTNQFTTSIEVTIRNFDKTDEIIAGMTGNGATNLYGPNLTVSDERFEEVKSKAREKAVAAARKKGEELARLSGRKLGKVTNINEQGEFGIPPVIYAQGAVDLRQKVSQIQPGQNDVTISLQVNFELK